VRLVRQPALATPAFASLALMVFSAAGPASVRAR
jgi:hypothetical protein